MQAAESETCGTGEILVVEDEESVRKMIIQMLEQLGYDVLSASSPQQAIDMFKDENMRPDLVLSDVIMPGMSGREMVQVIESVRHDIKVIYMSAYTPDMISQRGVFAENVNFIHKPFNISALNETIRKVLSKTEADPVYRSN